MNSLPDRESTQEEKQLKQVIMRKVGAQKLGAGLRIEFLVLLLLCVCVCVCELVFDSWCFC